MHTALVLFGSNSGNTAYLAKIVGSGLEKNGYDVVVKNVVDAYSDELRSYDLVVFGSSTWDGAKQEGLSPRDQNKAVQGNLQPDMKKFIGQLSNYDFQQRPVAVFGVGHYSYTFTANAGRLLEEFLQKANAHLVSESFRVSDVPDLYVDAIEQWASEITL
jgi:flavodoxin